MKKRSNWIGIGLIVVALIAHNYDLGKLIKIPTSLGRPPATTTEPSAEMQALVAPIQGKVTDKKDALKWASFYLSMADVVNRDPDAIKSMVQFMDLHRASLLAAFRTTSASSYKIGADLDRIIAMSLNGKAEFVPLNLDDTNRKRLVETLLALSWAFGKDA